jgi:hypothetical protein
VNADTDCVGFHVAFSDYEHGVDFHLFGSLDFARHLRFNWLLRTHGYLIHYNFMADGNPILAALELKAPGANRHWSFQVSDIVLTAALLAGGARPDP